MARRKRRSKARPPEGPYKITFADGRKVSMTQAEYERAHADGQLPKGTMVAHPGGWYVVGASIGDIFELD